MRAVYAGGVIMALVAWFAAPAGAVGVLADGGTGSIEADQAQIVRNAHSQAINVAQYAVEQFQSQVGRAQSVLAADQATAAHADAAKATALGQLQADSAKLTTATEVEKADDAVVAADRARMRVIAVGMYTGQLTDPQPSGLSQLAAEQKTIIDDAEVSVVARVLGRHIVTDVAKAENATKTREKDAAAVAKDKSTAADATAVAAAHQKAVAGDETVLSSAESRLSGAQAQLSSAEYAQQAQLNGVLAGEGSGISVLGEATLNASQLAGWYNAMGYANLTSTPIHDLAEWYIEVGQAEGVRGDVAFAQAVHETAGFSNNDSVEYNNYAGIGHCDNCATGWRFPSAYQGVVGQEQLLRIWGGGSSPSNPALPVLTVAKQPEAGCCSSFESLTGHWATDPGYGSEVLGLYDQMLQYALHH